MSLFSRDAVFTSCINCFTSFFSGFAVFAILGYLSFKTGKDISEVATEGKIFSSSLLLRHLDK